MDLQAKNKLDRALEGDIAAFQSLFGEFQIELRSFLYRLFADRNDALTALRDAMSDQAREGALKAGAGDIQLRLEEEIEEAEIEGQKTFVTASITAIATGRPRIAHG